MTWSCQPPIEEIVKDRLPAASQLLGTRQKGWRMPPCSWFWPSWPRWLAPASSRAARAHPARAGRGGRPAARRRGALAGPAAIRPPPWPGIDRVTSCSHVGASSVVFVHVLVVEDEVRAAALLRRGL